MIGGFLRRRYKRGLAFYAAAYASHSFGPDRACCKEGFAVLADQIWIFEIDGGG